MTRPVSLPKARKLLTEANIPFHEEHFIDGDYDGTSLVFATRLVARQAEAATGWAPHTVRQMGDAWSVRYY